ncbi:hypothetical protein IFR05_011970, partial [Cadophora sp. M221]
MASRSRTRYLYILLESLPWYISLLLTTHWTLLSTLPSTKLLTPLPTLTCTTTFLHYRHHAQTARIADADRACYLELTRLERACNDLVRSVPCALALCVFGG